MSRRSLAILVFACALLLTLGAWWQVIRYKNPPPGALALWLPFIVLLRAHDLAFLVWLVQFPSLAGIFVVTSLRWPPQRVIVVMLILYALCSWAAFLMLRARLWT